MVGKVRKRWERSGIHPDLGVPYLYAFITNRIFSHDCVSQFYCLTLSLSIRNRVPNEANEKRSPDGVMLDEIEPVEVGRSSFVRPLHVKLIPIRRMLNNSPRVPCWAFLKFRGTARKGCPSDGSNVSRNKHALISEPQQPLWVTAVLVTLSSPHPNCCHDPSDGLT